MKIALALLCATGASAFAPSPFAVGRASTAIMAEKINEKIDLESAKVVNNECLDPAKRESTAAAGRVRPSPSVTLPT